MYTTTHALNPCVQPPCLLVHQKDQDMRAEKTAQAAADAEAAKSARVQKLQWDRACAAVSADVQLKSAQARTVCAETSAALNVAEAAHTAARQQLDVEQMQAESSKGSCAVEAAKLVGGAERGVKAAMKALTNARCASCAAVINQAGIDQLIQASAQVPHSSDSVCPKNPVAAESAGTASPSPPHEASHHSIPAPYTQTQQLSTNLRYQAIASSEILNLGLQQPPPQVSHNTIHPTLGGTCYEPWVMNMLNSTCVQLPVATVTARPSFDLRHSAHFRSMAPIVALLVASEVEPPYVDGFCPRMMPTHWTDTSLEKMQSFLHQQALEESLGRLLTPDEIRAAESDAETASDGGHNVA